jgi:hypothetical protein
MVAQLRLARRTELARRLEHHLPTAPRQLDLILDDTRVRGMTLVERQAVLSARATPDRGERRGKAGGQR